MVNTKDWKHVKMQEDIASIYDDKIYKILFEVPYEHYGNSGYIDLVVEIKDEEWKNYLLFEVKTEIIDLGETIRQFKKMQKYCSYATKSLKNKCLLVLPFNKKNYGFVNQHLTFFNGIPLAFLCFERHRTNKSKYTVCYKFLHTINEKIITSSYEEITDDGNLKDYIFENKLKYC